jgi:hypothetical protein
MLAIFENRCLDHLVLGKETPTAIGNYQTKFDGRIEK